MMTKKKSSPTRQYTVGLDKELRSPLMKAIAVEMDNSGNYMSINSMVSHLVRIGLETKYPQVLK